MARRREEMTLNEWMDYITGAPAQWEIALGWAGATLIFFVPAGLVYGFGEGVGLSAQWSGLAAAIGGGLVFFKASPWAERVWARLRERRARRRRVAAGLLPTPECPSACDCPTHRRTPSTTP